MKKTIIFLIALFSLTGCEFINNNNDINTSTNINEASSVIEEYSSSSEEQETKELDNSYINFNASYNEWHTATLEDKYVVTVIGASYCIHCNNFKPIIEQMASDNKIDLYYYYIDQIEETESEKITTSYDSNYKGSVPHLFITKNGNVTTNSTGEMSTEDLTEFLKLNLVIQ